MARKLESTIMPVSLRLVKLNKERHFALLLVGVFGVACAELGVRGVVWGGISTCSTVGDRESKALSLWVHDDSESRN
jgi:hypothetical protein